MARDNKTTPEQSWISREDLQDIAKIGGDLLKRTVSSSIDVIKDVTDTLPKDASQIISKSREEMMKGLSREFAQNLVSLAVDRFFSAVREHRLDISIQVKKAGEPAASENSKPTRNTEHSENHTSQSRQQAREERHHHEKGGNEHPPFPRRNPPGRPRP